MSEKNTKNEKKPNLKDENMLAALAHVSALFLPVLVPLVIWLLHKDKSGYVQYQSKQALVFQVASWAAVSILSVVATVLSFFCIGVLLWPILIAIGFGAALYSIYACWETLNGRPFSYAYVDEVLGGR
ncbi:MAG: DUF4870 domain-containing protein [Candidatus Altiarchaeales archaeon]|nr:DUF4870 domain-containing protein [Candidatus Altiarchaeales archaeon]